VDKARRFALSSTEP